MITPMHWELSRVLPGLKSADTYQGIRIIRSEVGPQYKIGAPENAISIIKSN